MLEVKSIQDPKFPWGLFEAGRIIGRFQDREMAMTVMKSLGGGK